MSDSTNAGPTSATRDTHAREANCMIHQDVTRFYDTNSPVVFQNQILTRSQMVLLIPISSRYFVRRWMRPRPDPPSQPSCRPRIDSAPVLRLSSQLYRKGREVSRYSAPGLRIAFTTTRRRIFYDSSECFLTSLNARLSVSSAFLG